MCHIGYLLMSTAASRSKFSEKHPCHPSFKLESYNELSVLNFFDLFGLEKQYEYYLNRVENYKVRKIYNEELEYIDRLSVHEAICFLFPEFVSASPCKLFFNYIYILSRYINNDIPKLNPIDNSIIKSLSCEMNNINAEILYNILFCTEIFLYYYFEYKYKNDLQEKISVYVEKIPKTKFDGYSFRRNPSCPSDEESEREQARYDLENYGIEPKSYYEEYRQDYCTKIIEVIVTSSKYLCKYSNFSKYLIELKEIFESPYDYQHVDKRYECIRSIFDNQYNYNSNIQLSIIPEIDFEKDDIFESSNDDFEEGVPKIYNLVLMTDCLYSETKIKILLDMIRMRYNFSSIDIIALSLDMDNFELTTS